MKPRKRNVGICANGKFVDGYTVWSAIIQRCRGLKSTSYPLYGARGIDICDRWFESFSAFISDMGPRPPGASIDRIDNSKGYSPDNCRWANSVQQAQNRRTVRWLTHEGETLCISDWAKRKDLCINTIRNRIASGWTEADTLDTPVRVRRPRHHPLRITVEQRAQMRAMRASGVTVKNVAAHFSVHVATVMRITNSPALDSGGGK